MMDTGASHNCISKRMIKPLMLKVSEHTRRIKGVNSQAQSVFGMVYDVDVK